MRRTEEKSAEEVVVVYTSFVDIVSPRQNLLARISEHIAKLDHASGGISGMFERRSSRINYKIKALRNLFVVLEAVNNENSAYDKDLTEDRLRSLICEGCDSEVYDEMRSAIYRGVAGQSTTKTLVREAFVLLKTDQVLNIVHSVDGQENIPGVTGPG